MLPAPCADEFRASSPPLGWSPHRGCTPAESAQIVPLWLSCSTVSPWGLASPKRDPRYMVFSRWANLDDRWWAKTEYRNQLRRRLSEPKMAGQRSAVSLCSQRRTSEGDSDLVGGMCYV